MTPDAYRSAIERLGLSQVQAGAFLGASERTSRRWASEGAPRSVELALTYRIALAEIMEATERRSLPITNAVYEIAEGAVHPLERLV